MSKESKSFWGSKCFSLFVQPFFGPRKDVFFIQFILFRGSHLVSNSCCLPSLSYCPLGSQFLKTISQSSIEFFDDIPFLVEQFIKWHSVASGGGNAGRFPRPEIGKIVVEIWYYLPEVYTFGVESEIQEIFSKNCEKCQFSIEILIKKSQNFLKMFQNSLHFWSNRAKFCRQVA